MSSQCSRLNLNTNHVSQHFFLFLQVSNKPSYVNLYEKFKIDGRFSHKTQILPIGKNFQEIGQKYKQICINGWNMAQNVVCTNKNFQNYSRGLQDTSQKADFERESTLVHPYHINEKVAG